MKSTLEQKVDELLNLQKKKEGFGILIFAIAVFIARVFVNFFTTKLLWNIGAVKLLGFAAIGNIQVVGLILMLSFFKYMDYSNFARVEKQEITKSKMFGNLFGYTFVGFMCVSLVWLLTLYI